jgi:hypothetical protein
MYVYMYHEHNICNMTLTYVLCVRAHAFMRTLYTVHCTLCIHMYVCMYVHIQTHTYIFLHIYMYICVFVGWGRKN